MSPINAVLDETFPNMVCGVTLMEQLSQKVRELRKKAGLTQEDLARQLEVSLSTVQRWEGKGAKPTRLARRELKRLLQKAGIGEY